MENGLMVKTTEGSPQGGPLSPLLANIYLNEYDKEMAGRGVPVIRYADDIVVLAKSPRAAHRLLETMESPKSEDTKPHETGHTEVLCL